MNDTHLFSIFYRDVEKLLKEQEKKSNKVVTHPEDYSWTPIGYFESCFSNKNATPRQGQLCSMTRGKFTYKIGNNPALAIEDLKYFSHCWLIFLFHKNREKEVIKQREMRQKIQPPRLNGKHVSVFATRSPHRPNKIGLTRAKIEKIEGNTIYFSQIDLIDQTPIIDISNSI